VLAARALEERTRFLTMQTIHAVLFEPVGCLAEFPALEFDQIAARLFAKSFVNSSGSDAYWQVVGLIKNEGGKLNPPDKQIAETLELQAVNKVELYEDVVPALSELKNMGIQLFIASSLSGAAIRCFLEKFVLQSLFSGVWNRDNAGGVESVPLAKAMESASLQPEHVISLVDTIESLQIAREFGTHSILMINDYEQGRRVALHSPTGGIVSLRELPDAIRLAAESAKSPRG
jgi:phosphoglycolate phosphatase-like HAD superfamily hydrolase